MLWCAVLRLPVQEESLHWMVNNYRGQIVSGRWKPRNCILGDEMGLGKTAQSIAVISWLKQFAGAAAPCMVVAPLTTLGHWKREIETWTDLVSNTKPAKRVLVSLHFWKSAVLVLNRVAGNPGPYFGVAALCVLPLLLRTSQHLNHAAVMGAVTWSIVVGQLTFHLSFLTLWLHRLPLLLQNVVLYAGSAEDRRLIRDYEFHYPGKKVGWDAHTDIGCLLLHVLSLRYATREELVGCRPSGSDGRMPSRTGVS
jgi:hypothetical protein